MNQTDESGNIELSGRRQLSVLFTDELSATSVLGLAITSVKVVSVPLTGLSAGRSIRAFAYSSGCWGGGGA